MADTAIGGPRTARALPSAAARRGGKRWQLAIVALVIVGAIGYLVYNGLGTNVYYQTVSELQGGNAAWPADPPGRQCRRWLDRARRRLGRWSVSWSPTLAATLPVVYKGVVPDIFGPGIEVVVEGKYNASHRLRRRHDARQMPLEVRYAGRSGGEVVGSRQSAVGSRGLLLA